MFIPLQVQQQNVVADSMEDLIAQKQLGLPTNKSNFNNFLPSVPYSVSVKTGDPKCASFSSPSISQGFDYLFLRGETIRRLIGKSKRMRSGAKLTSILATILTLSMKRLLKKVQDDDADDRVDLDHLQYEVMVSLRSKLDISNTQMGVYSVAIENVFRRDLSERKFWAVAGEQSRSLHRKIALNVDIANVESTQAVIACINDKTKNFARHNMFTLSNVGRITPHNDHNLIQIKKHFVVQSLRDYGTSGSFFNGISSVGVNEDLCWSFTYNEKYYSKQFVKCLMQMIVKLINKLSTENEE